MIEITPLRYFLSAVDTGTFTGAARANQVSQPSVSAAIQKIETRLGGKLFLRSKAGLKPTALGLEMYQMASSIVEQMQSLESRLLQQTRKTIRIYCQPDILLTPYAPALNTLGRNMPELQFSFANTAEDCDISFSAQDCTPVGHQFLPLETEEYGIALARSHPLSQAKSLSLEDVAKYPIIARPYCPRADQFLQSVTLPVAANAIHDQQVLDLIAAGLGIAITPLSHARSHSGIVVRALISPKNITRTVGLTHRKTAFSRDLASALLDHIGH
jgi:DNA-binding transcriptional LysR family regulator